MPVNLDTKGLTCPLPILKTKKAMMRLDVDDILCVETTDPGSVKDFEVFCQTKGHQLIEATQKDNIFFFSIKKSS